MGLFKNLFGGNSSNTENSIWETVESVEDLDKIFLVSLERPQIIFKHSTNCGVSFFVMRNLNTPEIYENDQIDLHLIDVIRNRSISQVFAERIDVRHESPQIFIIKDGEVIWHASHNLVNAKNVIENLG